MAHRSRRTWAVITLGSALNILGLDMFPVGVGFWAQIVSAAFAIAGTLLLMTDHVGREVPASRMRPHDAS
jgi:hypothetical protein